MTASCPSEIVVPSGTPPSTSAAATGEQPRTSTTDREIAWVSSTYFAEGLPFSLVHKISSEYLVAAGVSPRIIGLSQISHLPWNIKFLWAPLLDRFGTTKRWMVGVQLAMAAVTLFLAAFAATFVPWAFFVGLVLLAVLAATNDVAIDGYYLRRLDEKQQTALSGVRVAAYRVALLVGAGGIVVLAGLKGFPLAFTVAGAGLAVLALVHAVALARDTSTQPKASMAGVVLGAARTFFSQAGIVPSVILLLYYKAGDALMFAMNSKFLETLGLDTTRRGLINGTLGTIFSIAGSVAGSAIITRFGFKRTFVPLTLLQSLALLLYVGLAAARPSLGVIAGAVVIEQFVAGAGTAAFSVFLMRLCRGAQQTTQFAFASSVMSVAMLGAGAASGYLFEGVGSVLFFVIAFAASVPGVVASLFVPKEPLRDG